MAPADNCPHPWNWGMNLNGKCMFCLYSLSLAKEMVINIIIIIIIIILMQFDSISAMIKSVVVIYLNKTPSMGWLTACRMNLKRCKFEGWTVEHPYTAMYHPIWALNTLKHKISYTKIYKFHHFGGSRCVATATTPSVITHAKAISPGLLCRGRRCMQVKATWLWSQLSWWEKKTCFLWTAELPDPWYIYNLKHISNVEAPETRSIAFGELE